MHLYEYMFMYKTMIYLKDNEGKKRKHSRNRVNRKT